MILPKVAILELTSRCNHSCLFCYCPWEYDKDYKNVELSTQEIFNLIDLYTKYGVEHFTLSGGEPLMRDDLFDIIEYIKSKNLSLGIISNGRKVDDEFLKKLFKYKVLLSISVPGINTYKDHTGIDNIEHILSIFSKCKELKINTAANITVTKKNLPELYENISLPIINGAGYVLLNRFLPGGRGMFNKEYLLTKEDINTMLNVAEEVLELSGASGHVGTELPYCIIDNYEKYKHLKIATTCGAAKTFFVTDPSGYIKVCNHSPEKLCKWNEIETLENNLTWNRYLTSDFIPTMCKKCDHLKKCDGGCREAARVNYGKINDIDPCFCCIDK